MSGTVIASGAHVRRSLGEGGKQSPRRSWAREIASSLTLLAMTILVTPPAWAPNRTPYAHMSGGQCDAASGQKLSLEPVKGKKATYEFCIAATATDGIPHAYVNDVAITITEVDDTKEGLACYHITFPNGIGGGIAFNIPGTGCFVGIAKPAKAEPGIMQDDDDDNDALPDAQDNCDIVANDDQTDFDQDGKGNVCDDDDDGDGVPDAADNCISVMNADQADADGDHVGDPCDPDVDGNGAAAGSDVVATGTICDEETGVCCPDVDSDEDGVVDCFDQCNDTTDPTNSCVSFAKSLQPYVVQPGEDGFGAEGGCSLLARVRTRNGTGAMLCALVVVMAFLLARQFRKTD